MRGDDHDKPELQDRDHVGIVTGAGATGYGIDAKHLGVGGKGKTRHDPSWRSKAEEEPEDVDATGEE